MKMLRKLLARCRWQQLEESASLAPNGCRTINLRSQRSKFASAHSSYRAPTADSGGNFAPILLKNSVAGILAFAGRNGIASNPGILPDRTNQFRNVVIDEFAFQQHVAEIAFAIIPRSFSTVSATSCRRQLYCSLCGKPSSIS